MNPPLSAGILASVFVLALPGPGRTEESAASYPIQTEALPAETRNTVVWQSGIPVFELEHGIGAEYRDAVNQALNLVVRGDTDGAEQLLEAPLQRWAAEAIRSDRKAVCLANRAEFEAFRAENPGQEVVWLDYALGKALHLMTFIAVTRRDFAEALQLSDRELMFRPYAASAFTERGSILNQLHRPAEALEAYQTALKLAERFASSENYRAVALRGIGFTQVELGDLQSARATIEASLKLEPDNRIALGELEYINKLLSDREVARPGVGSPAPGNGG